MTDMISFGDALKVFRRGVHVYGKDWKGVVLAPTFRVREEAENEAARIFEASSIMATYQKLAHKFLCEPSGAFLQFRVVIDMMDGYMLAGNTFTQVIWLLQPASHVEAYVRSMLRSNVVPLKLLRVDYSEL